MADEKQQENNFAEVVNEMMDGIENNVMTFLMQQCGGRILLAHQILRELIWQIEKLRGVKLIDQYYKHATQPKTAEKSE